MRGLMRSVRAAEERDHLLNRLNRIYGVKKEVTLAALQLPREKRIGAESLSREDLRNLFGRSVEFINTARSSLPVG